MSNELGTSWQQLVDWLESRLTPTEAEYIASQIAANSEAANSEAVSDEAASNQSTAADLAWLRAFFHAAGEVSIEEPPQELRTALRTTFADYVTAKSNAENNQGSLFERLVAALSFDSGLQLGLAGTRAASASRHLVYSTDAADISLSIQTEGDDLHIDGQILPIGDLPLDEFRVHLLQHDQPIDTVLLDELGGFIFADVQPGSYQLSMATESLAILIDLVDLQEQR